MDEENADRNKERLKDLFALDADVETKLAKLMKKPKDNWILSLLLTILLF